MTAQSSSAGTKLTSPISHWSSFETLSKLRKRFCMLPFQNYVWVLSQSLPELGPALQYSPSEGTRCCTRSFRWATDAATSDDDAEACASFSAMCPPCSTSPTTGCPFANCSSVEGSGSVCTFARCCIHGGKLMAPCFLRINETIF